MLKMLENWVIPPKMSKDVKKSLDCIGADFNKIGDTYMLNSYSNVALQNFLTKNKLS